MKKQDIIIIGGGIMGLMTAYYASSMGKKVTILEKSFIGNKDTASYGITRSIRNDYLDPFYTLLAKEARILWEELEEKSTKKFIIDSGCLNIAKKDITPDLSKTYAEKSFRNISNLKIESENFSKEELKKRFPQFEADLGTLDVKAGFLYVPTITELLLKILKQQNVKIVENVKVQKIYSNKASVIINTSELKLIADKLVIVAGLGTNDVLKQIDNCSVQFPLLPDRPSECKYYIPAAGKEYLFTPKNFPVFAYLDIGIYGHPFYNKDTKGVKIGYYNPADIKKVDSSKIKNIADFINECMPSLKDATVIDVKNADGCSYDMVEDDDFILGNLLGSMNIFVGVGWRGTGYKFAPLIGKVLSDLSILSKTDYNIKRFSPGRFESKLKKALKISPIGPIISY